MMSRCRVVSGVAGFLYALIDKSDSYNAAVLSVLQHYRGRILLPVPAITEISYLIGKNCGVQAQVSFLKNLTSIDYELTTPELSDYSRSAEILDKYDDANIDFVDALIVAMAERLNITTILTIDRRHFRMFRPSHCEAFEIFPS